MTARAELARLCASHGIEPDYVGMDGKRRAVPVETLQVLAEILELKAERAHPPGTIDDALDAADPPRCFVPEGLRGARVWGITCQLPSLASMRNLGMGDLADLAALCRIAGAAGADFVGVNPLHALFWSAPERVSPFFPSNRRFLNPAYIAIDWLRVGALTDEEQREAERLRKTPLLDIAAAIRLKDRILRRIHGSYGWCETDRRSYARFCARHGSALTAHAVFEALSEVMVAEGHGAGWSGWPAPYRDASGSAVAGFASDNAMAVDYHRWLQWVADAQLERVRAEAESAGLRIGLYLDMAVGAADDGSAAWTDPHLTVPALSVGAPPDPLGPLGQDWGLAPLAAPRLEETEGAPLAETVDAVMRHAGALRLDHAMSLARMWLIPRGTEPLKGAYMRYPLQTLLRRLAEVSQRNGTLVVGEDLGLVPPGFSDLIQQRGLHSYLVFLIDRGGAPFPVPADWPVDALACLATHDMPTFTGWWRGEDIALRRRLGLEDDAQARARAALREQDRARIADALGQHADTVALSTRLHAHVASSPARLFALQIEDALGVAEQVNVPGTIDAYPNWRQRLPVTIEALGADPGFRAHVAALARVRPK
ncbi:MULTISPECIES: 4-alpha-glucanotransferase [unclassified Roseitalea]|uniref:4-alpha-glucanotransferase n=1 Tax=unclassified Roseitalea TaxID=2639107 RepID=UPI00273FED8E|nr:MULTISPECIES: 4-alpha-glucanotransferase [unclassified Roseitalea]